MALCERWLFQAAWSLREAAYLLRGFPPLGTPGNLLPLSPSAAYRLSDPEPASEGTPGNSLPRVPWYRPGIDSLSPVLKPGATQYAFRGYPRNLGRPTEARDVITVQYGDLLQWDGKPWSQWISFGDILQHLKRGALVREFNTTVDDDGERYAPPKELIQWYIGRNRSGVRDFPATLAAEAIRCGWLAVNAERELIPIPEARARSGAKAASKKRGRPPGKYRTDRKADKKMADAWATRSYKTHEELATALNKPVLDVKHAIDRHRKREAAIRR